MKSCIHFFIFYIVSVSVELACLLSTDELLLNVSHFFIVLLNARHYFRETRAMAVIVILEQIDDLLMLEINQTLLNELEVE